MPVETRYMRSDLQTVNGLTACILGLTQSAQEAQTSAYCSGIPTYTGVRAWIYIRDANGNETLLGSCEVRRTGDGEGLQSVEWSCPQKSLNPTDAIVVRAVAFAGGTESPVHPFITEQLGTTILNAVTWTFWLWNQRYYDSKLDQTYSYFRYGIIDYNSRIENFTYGEAPPPVVWGGDTHQIQMAKAILGLYLPWSKRFPKVVPRMF